MSNGQRALFEPVNRLQEYAASPHALKEGVICPSDCCTLKTIGRLR
jgi:hypothetical protein